VNEPAQTPPPSAPKGSAGANKPLGVLYLMPNTLDLGTSSPLPDIQASIPLGAMHIAARLTHWIAENAKSARALLKRIDAVTPLATPLQSIHIAELPRPQKGSPRSSSPTITPLLAPALAGHDIGLVSEAGLPAVADPGSAVVRAAHEAGIRVVAIPGPSSLLLALAASGLNGQSFAFCGYLPVDGNERAQRIRELEATSRRQSQTQLMIETPYRNQVLFSALLTTLHPGTHLAVSCGITLVDGFTRSDTVAHWRSNPPTLPNDVPAVFSLLAA
jgi:16S rRNA (cytidine1402-2'-O)-methyltransferase